MFEKGNHDSLVKILAVSVLMLADLVPMLVVSDTWETTSEMDLYT
jgi:hypothetical protein